jgi:hypothetical protein
MINARAKARWWFVARGRISLAGAALGRYRSPTRVIRLSSGAALADEHERCPERRMGLVILPVRHH